MITFQGRHSRGDRVFVDRAAPAARARRGAVRHTTHTTRDMTAAIAGATRIERINWIIELQVGNCDFNLYGRET